LTSHKKSPRLQTPCAPCLGLFGDGNWTHKGGVYVCLRV
jgi:hypothetical protein